MAPRPPLYLQGLSYEAKQLRREMSALLGYARFVDLSPSISLSNQAHGVCEAGHLKVTEKSGTPNMSVDVAVGAAFIAGTRASDQGCLFGENDAVYNVTVPTAHGTNPRKDLIVARVRDAAYSGASNILDIYCEQGTAAASPVDPTVPDDCIVLARVDVPALDTAITNSQITDLRTAASVWTLPRGEVAYAQITASSNTANTTAIDLAASGVPLTATFTALPGRKLKVTAFAPNVFVNTANVEEYLYITDGSNNVLQEARVFNTTTAKAMPYAEAKVRVLSGAGGATTFKARIRANTGTMQVLASSTAPAFILVEDIGGYVV